MGRELRMVPAGWEHPKRERFDVVTLRNEESYHPLYDQSAQDAWEEWESEYRAWLDGGFAKCCEEHPDLGYDESEPYRSFCAWHGEPPTPSYYRPPWDDSERTWFQVYETVSEGTPVTPPFATRGELIDYLITHGDFWDQKRRAEGNSSMRCDPWSREMAESFVNDSGWAPSLVCDSKGLRSGVEAMVDHGQNSTRTDVGSG